MTETKIKRLEFALEALTIMTNEDSPLTAHDIAKLKEVKENVIDELCDAHAEGFILNVFTVLNGSALESVFEGNAEQCIAYARRRREEDEDFDCIIL